MAETIANPESLTLGRALGQASKLIRLLEEAGLSQAALQTPIDDANCRRELVVAWENLVHPNLADDTQSCTLAVAAQIMGDNFHGPAAVKKRLDINLGRGQQWKTVPFGAGHLRAVAETHVLLAVPEVSIMDLHTKASQLFYSKNNPWYGERHQRNAFGGQKLTSGWYLVRKEAIPDSTNRWWNDQWGMVQAPDFVPEANLGVYAYVLHYLDTGERLISRAWVRTNSLTAGGDRVVLRGGAEGLGLGNWYEKPNSNVGVLEARKSN